MRIAQQARYRGGLTDAFDGGHVFVRVCSTHGIAHRVTKPYHPWTTGQAERMIRTVKEVTIKSLHYPDLEAPKAHVLAFVTVHKFAKHLKALHWRTPFQAICEVWSKGPTRFKRNPPHLSSGPNT